MEDIVLREKVAHLEERAKSNTHRIDNLEEKVEDIHELASSVKLLASETKAMREDVNNMNDRLQQLEEKPLKEYEDTRKKVKDKALMFALGIIFTYIALKLRTRKFYIRREKKYGIHNYDRNCFISIFSFVFNNQSRKNT